MAAVLILGLSVRGTAGRLGAIKDLLAWTQILLLLVLAYGAQLVFRDDTKALFVWAAFPPAWVQYLPSAWLAHFVAEAGEAGAANGPFLIHVSEADHDRHAYRRSRGRATRHATRRLCSGYLDHSAVSVRLRAFPRSDRQRPNRIPGDTNEHSPPPLLDPRRRARDVGPALTGSMGTE